MKILLKNLFLPFPLIPEEKDGLILISIRFIRKQFFWQISFCVAGPYLIYLAALIASWL